MEGKPVIAPISFEDLRELDKKQALEAVNLIKEKRCGKLKGQTCANGSRQRQYLKEGEDYDSPTALLESSLTTLVIDAWEERDVAVADVPCAYLHASFPQDKQVILKLQGVFVNIMCGVNPYFKKHVVKPQKVIRPSNAYMYAYSGPCMDVSSQCSCGMNSTPPPLRS